MKSIICDNCGAVMEWDNKTGMFVCRLCGCSCWAKVKEKENKEEKK